MGSNNVEDIYELSPLQRGMLLHSVHDGAADMYLSQQTYLADGPLDVESVVRASQAVVDAHPALRTSFHWAGLDKPLQVVRRNVTLPVHRHDWSDVDDEQQRKRLEQLRADDSAAGMDLTTAPLQRLNVVRLGENRHLVIWTCHHLLMDGASMGIFAGDALAHYHHLTAGGPRPPAPPPFRDYIAWLQRQDPDSTRSFWEKLLGGVAPGQMTTLKPPDPLRSTGAVDRRDEYLSQAVLQGLREAAARHRVTFATTAQAAWAIVLRRLSDRPEVTFGAVSSGRPVELPRVDRIIGVFANTLPARLTVPDDGDLGAWLREVQHIFAQMRRHEHTPLADIKRWAGAPGRQLFDSSLSVETNPTPTAPGGAGGLTFRQMAIAEKVNLPVALAITPGAASVQLLLHRERFEPGFIDDLMARLKATLDAMITADRIGAVAAAAGPIVAAQQIVNATPANPSVTTLEEAIAAVYRDILEVAEVDVTASFFDLGGDSFDAVRAIGRIDGASVGLLAANPSARELAQALAPAQGQPAAEALVAVPREATMPCTYQQEAVWFMRELNPITTSYHVPVALRLRGDLDLAALERALHALVVRHEALRTRFVDDHGVPRQVIDPAPASLRLPVTDLDPDRLGAWAAGECARPFDLEAGPTFRLAAARLAPDDHALVLVAHHIIVDGWSVAVMGRELSTLYAAEAAGQPAQLPPLHVQPADFAAWQRRWLAGPELDRRLGYWRDKLAGMSTVELATDRPRAPRSAGTGTAFARRLPDDLAIAAREYARTHRVSFLAVLNAALFTVLHRYTGRRDLAVGSLFSGRTRPDIDPMVGFFGNTVVLRTGLHGDPSFAELVGRCHETVIEATTHQDVPFHLVVDALRPKRVPGANPLFQMTLTLHPTGITGAGLTLGEVALETIDIEDSYAMFDIAVDVLDSADGALGVIVEYRTDLFDADRMHRLLDDFTAALANGLAAADDVRARTETERWLASVWHDLLGVVPTGTRENFFDLGGNSLHTTRLVSRVREERGVHIGPIEVFIHPTIEQLAARLDAVSHAHEGS